MASDTLGTLVASKDPVSACESPWAASSLPGQRLSCWNWPVFLCCTRQFPVPASVGRCTVPLLPCKQVVLNAAQELVNWGDSVQAAFCFMWFNNVTYRLAVIFEVSLWWRDSGYQLRTKQFHLFLDQCCSIEALWLNMLFTYPRCYLGLCARSCSICYWPVITGHFV